jgi:hypothetical protein
LLALMHIPSLLPFTLLPSFTLQKIALLRPIGSLNVLLSTLPFLCDVLSSRSISYSHTSVLKVEEVDFSKTLVCIYQTAWHRILEA